LRHSFAATKAKERDAIVLGAAAVTLVEAGNGGNDVKAKL